MTLAMAMSNVSMKLHMFSHVMHLSISCPTDPGGGGGGGGGGDTGDLTNRDVKFPTTGAKLAVKFPLCPRPHSRGFDNTSRLTKRIFHACD